jgi:hypothetical protein
MSRLRAPRVFWPSVFLLAVLLLATQGVGNAAVPPTGPDGGRNPQGEDMPPDGGDSGDPDEFDIYKLPVDSRPDLEGQDAPGKSRALLESLFFRPARFAEWQAFRIWLSLR